MNALDGKVEKSNLEEVYNEIYKLINFLEESICRSEGQVRAAFECVLNQVMDGLFNRFTTHGGEWFIYIVRSARGHLYTGATTNVERRIKQHNSGKGSKALLGQLPVELVWSVGNMGRREALQLESRIKSWTAKEKELLILGENDHRL